MYFSFSLFFSFSFVSKVSNVTGDSVEFDARVGEDGMAGIVSPDTDNVAQHAWTG